jgi:excisionase family DNA binding protein
MTVDERPWITLGAAGALLGVSESTIRRWADSGELGSYRTSGGHRRIRAEDVRGLMTGSGPARATDTDHISDIALARVKRRLNRGRGGAGHGQASFEGLDDRARDHLRVSGRQLVDLVARYIASGSKPGRFNEDARIIGNDYGRTLVDAGFSLTKAITTFNSLRRSLEETASQIASESELSTEDSVEAIEDVLGLADTVLEGMASVYEEAAQGS